MAAITSVDAFIRRVEEEKGREEAAGNHNDLLFRGHRHRAWELRPRLARAAPGVDPLAAEPAMLAEFARVSRPFVAYPPQNRWELLALAQHHGLPTRLLDWTHNALAALWFAVKEPPQAGAPAAVWLLKPVDGDFVGPRAGDPLRLRRTLVFRPALVSRRIEAQAGVFTCHAARRGRLSDLTEEPALRRRLLRLEVAPAAFSAIRRQLNACGVNYAAMFPDLDGICSNIAWRFLQVEAGGVPGWEGTGPSG